MLTKRTVFVLGAGASDPFGFPTGIKLSKAVVAGLKPGLQMWISLQTHLGFSDEQLVEFREAFFYSGKNSVDAFLEHRPEHIKIGKAATAEFLIRYESSENLFGYDENWYRYLYGKMNAPIKEFGNNTIAFVTFNYDRSLEHFLFTTLKNTYGVSDEVCAEVLTNIPIIHLHGRLGYLPWQEGGKIRRFTPELNAETLQTCIDNIKIIHEATGVGSDKEFLVAKNLLHQAERIYFMGFGYDPTNVARLNIRNLEAGRSAGSCLGIEGVEIENTKAVTGGKISFANPYHGCYVFLRQYCSWD